MSYLTVLDILATMAFAVSGMLEALEKRMDTFGVFIIAFVTAVGGGTLRDILIGETPVFWMENLVVVYAIIITTILAIIFRKHLNRLRKSLVLFDTIGIGLYTVVGIQKGLLVDLHPIVCIALGTMSASFGGVIRDTLCNEIPVIFQKEIYATACVAGGVVYFGLSYFNLGNQWLVLISILTVILIRLLAVAFKISLPSLYKDN
ncbi:trimeric intracellular cation channel family protein [Winogradskyella aurantiaca]|uniref:trimeric intracellular cation channel family protein n=1 Tax=Winogradskyella aurantiaca TaxID=2219558 RepID=UPI000E1D8867|nr:trimeric intracellular cation channel family protein [Winogradskyella aurantiaca]